MGTESWLNENYDDFLSLLKDDELAEEPVPVEVFIKDKQFLGIKAVSDLQQKIITSMSQIFLPPTLEKLYGIDEANRIWEEETVNEVVAMCGKGSGKDFCSRIGFAYTIYKLHCLKDPVGYFGKASGTYIDLLNLAVNAEQAQNVFFDPLRNMMGNSPWFQGVGFEPRKKEITFYERPIRLFSGNSEAEAWEGLDLLLVVLDEIAAFKTEGQLKGENRNRLSAKAIYDMAKISVISRFPEVGKCLLLSFPRYRGDFIMQRYEESAGEPKVLRIKAKTWEMNPLITREQLNNEFLRKPVESKARFECEPPMAVDAFFRDPDRVRSCFKANVEVIDSGTPLEKILYHEIPELNPVDEFGRLKSWFKPGDNYPRFIHVDLGQKRDRAALCMSHSPGTRRVEVGQGVWENLPVVKMDLIHWWDAQEGQEIDFQDIREFIALLHKKFPVAMVTFDQWQSVDMMQTLNKRGIYSELHPVKITDYDNLSTCFYDGRFSGYYNSILIDQELLKLQCLPGRKIDHPNVGSKDLADALAGSVQMTCMYVDIDQEIDIDIIGTDDDWEAAELADALADEEPQKRKPKQVHHVEYTEPEDDMSFEVI